MFGNWSAWDWVWVGGLAVWAGAPNGPVSVLVTAAWLLHLVRGRPRVQLLATYPLVLALVRGVLLGGLRKDKLLASVTGGWLRAHPTAAVAVCLALAAAAVLHMLMPLDARLPPPTGPWEPAVLVVRLQNPNRGTDTMCRVYHPAQLARDGPVQPIKYPYLMHGGFTAAGYATSLRLPGFVFSWLQHIRSHIWDGDPEAAAPPARGDKGRGGAVAPERFPVIVFSHGRSGTPDCYSTLIADWVSHGWVVIAPDHADGSAAFTAFPDGFSITYEPSTAKEEADVKGLYRKWHRMLKQRVTETQAAIDLAFSLDGRRTVPGESSRASGEGAAADAGAFTVYGAPDKRTDDLELLHVMLGGRLDARRLALAGHSFGAATCVATAERETRIRAVLAHDTWMFPLSALTVKRGLSHVPVLSVCGEGFTKWRENAVAVRLLLSAAFRAKYAADAATAAGARMPHAGAVRDDDAPPGSGSGHKAEEAVRDVYLDTPGNGVSAKGEVHESVVTAGAVHPGHTLLTLVGAMHQNFNDFPLIVPLLARRLRMAGTGNPVAVNATLCDISRAFLDQVVATGRPAARAGEEGGRFTLPPDVVAGKHVLTAVWEGDA
jgi:dienelactone hydrolase